MKNNTQNNFRPRYAYFGPNGTFCTIPVSSIHEAALPQTNSFMSERADAQSFQKCSNAEMKLDFGVSIHGNSSKKSTFIFCLQLST